MHDREAKSFIKINLNTRARAAAWCLAGPIWARSLVEPRMRFQRANRELGRPQSDVKRVTRVSESAY